MGIPFRLSKTLEKMARALELPLYHLMYDGDKVPEAPIAIASNGDKPQTLGLGRKEAHYLEKLRRLLAKMKSEDRKTAHVHSPENGAW